MSGKLICFEPQVKLFQLLQNNLAMNGLTNVESYQIGVGEQTEVLEVETTDYKTDWNYGSFSLDKGFSTEFQFDGQVDKVPLQVVALDDFEPIKHLQHLDLLKIDAEGFDIKVLRGAQKTLAKFKPFIFVECGEESADNLVQALNELDYQPFWVVSKRYQEKNFRQVATLANHAADANFLGIPKSLLAEIEHPHSLSSELRHQKVASLIPHLVKATSFEQFRRGEVPSLSVL